MISSMRWEKKERFQFKRFELDGQGTRRERREESLDRSMSFNQIRRYEEEFDDRCREKEREEFFLTAARYR